MTSEDIIGRACPFCGAPDEKLRLEHWHDVAFRMACGECGSRGPERKTKGEALADWNRRAHDMPADWNPDDEIRSGPEYAPFLRFDFRVYPPLGLKAPPRPPLKLLAPRQWFERVIDWLSLN